MNELTDFEPAEILRVLAEHEVEFIVMGGLASALHGAEYVTIDLDGTPRRTAKNLDRLSAALEILDARIRVVGIPDGLPFSHDGPSLGQSAVWSLQTRFGDLDLALEPAGFGGGWDELRP